MGTQAIVARSLSAARIRQRQGRWQLLRPAARQGAPQLLHLQRRQRHLVLQLGDLEPSISGFLPRATELCTSELCAVESPCVALRLDSAQLRGAPAPAAACCGPPASRRASRSAGCPRRSGTGWRAAPRAAPPAPLTASPPAPPASRPQRPAALNKMYIYICMYLYMFIHRAFAEHYGIRRSRTGWRWYGAGNCRKAAWH